MMTAIYRPNSSWGPPPSAIRKPNPNVVERQLAALTPIDQRWTRARDLAAAEAICAGKCIADVAARLRLSEATVRVRWSALKDAACIETGHFGIFEQEALLLALRNLETRPKPTEKEMQDA